MFAWVRLAAATTALLVVGTVLALPTAPETTPIERESRGYEGLTIEAAEQHGIIAGDLHDIVDVLEEVIPRIEAGADPSYAIEKAISTRTLAFSQLATGQLTAEEMEQCEGDEFAYVPGISPVSGTIVNLCSPHEVWTDPFGIQLIPLQGWAFLQDCYFFCLLRTPHVGFPSGHAFHHGNPDLDALLDPKGVRPQGIVLGELTGTGRSHAGGYYASISGTIFGDPILGWETSGTWNDAAWAAYPECGGVECGQGTATISTVAGCPDCVTAQQTVVGTQTDMLGVVQHDAEGLESAFVFAWGGPDVYLEPLADPCFDLCIVI